MKTILNKILPVDLIQRKGVPDTVEKDRDGSPAAGQVIDSARLFAGTREVVIRHQGRDYRLRLTRLGKLILTA